MNLQLRTCVSAIALFGSLGAFVPGTAGAAVVLIPTPGGSCPAPSTSGDRESAVLDAVVPGSPNAYGYTICNTSNLESIWRLRDWELPYDPAGGIANITAPEGWAYSIETIGIANPNTGWEGIATWLDPSDPFYDPRYLGLTQVIHFYTCDGLVESSCYGAFGPALAPGEFLSGFGFTSPFGPTGAPYQASWVQEIPRSGDPLYPIGAAPNTPGLLPEPGGLALFALALASLMGARAARRKEETA